MVHAGPSEDIPASDLRFFVHHESSDVFTQAWHEPFPDDGNVMEIDEFMYYVFVTRGYRES